MEPWVQKLVIIMGTLVTTGVFALTFTVLKLRHDRLMRSQKSADLDQLHDELAQLRDDSNAQIAELHERLDFAERLLAQQRDPALPAPPAPPARKRTPV
jgi:hypothetical protein